MLKRLSTCTIYLSFILVMACNSYDFTINDKVVYTPDPLFTDFDIPDSALRKCVKEAINDNKVTSANQLLSLSCSQLGIETLAGLATFNEIGQLTLSNNNIADISELAALTVLETLYMANNKVVDPVPLYQLPALQKLDLSGNSGLLCPQSGSLLRVADVTLPRHCR